mgnify:CR=1 FL=1
MKAGCWIICLFLGVGSVYAQEPLELSEAIKRCLEKNYEIEIQEGLVEQAENNNSWGEAGRFPSLNLSVSQTNRASDAIKVGSPFQPLGVTISNSLDPQVNLNWVLFDGFRANITEDRLEQLQFETQGNADIVLSNTLQALILAYYRTSLEQERLEVFENTLKLSRDKYQYLQSKQSYGAAVTSDVLLEEGNYLTDSVNFINQQLTYKKSFRELNRLMVAKNPNETYELGVLEAPMNSYEYTDLEQKALAGNIDLKKKYVSQSIIKHEIELSRASSYPKFSMDVNAGTSIGQTDFSNAEFFDQTTREYVSGPSDPQSTVTNNYGLNFSITYNLFNGKKVNRAIKNALIRENIGDLEIESMKYSLQTDLRNALDEYQIRQQIYFINKRKMESAKLNLQISEEKFKLGAINSFDFRTVQINYITAALQELNSRFGLKESELNLMRLTGGILEVYANNP